MLCALALYAASLAGFPEAPLADQVALGRKIARTEPRLSPNDLFRSQIPRASFRKVWGADRQPIGWWSNGYVKVAAEDAVWVSPALVSRWLGFLAGREYWEDGELESRWKSIASAIGDRRLFVVQLTAYPKMPAYGMSEYERTTPEEIENVRFVYTSGDKSVRMEAERIAQLQSRRRDDLEDFPWWQRLAIGRALTGEFEGSSLEEPLPLGDYYRAWYAVWVTGAAEPAFEVRVLSHRKERVAKFKASS